jgi:hypothetical protein
MKVFGYAPPGPLFGRRNGPDIDINSPFRKGKYHNDQVIAKPLLYGNSMDPLREYFANHAWIEIQLPNGQVRVLDVTHGIRRILEHMSLQMER